MGRHCVAKQLREDNVDGLAIANDALGDQVIEEPTKGYIRCNPAIIVVVGQLVREVLLPDRG